MEEETEMSELYAEILENWTTPTNSNLVFTSPKRNPFSLHHHQPSDIANDVKEQLDTTYTIFSDVPQSSSHGSQCDQQATLSCTNAETRISMSKLKYEDAKHDFESEHKEDIVLKAHKLTNGKATNGNSNMSMDRPIIPVLVADTFFDKLLGCGADGIDIAALNEVEGAKACKNDAETSTAAANKGKEMEKLDSGQMPSLFKSNFLTANRMPERSPISGEYRSMPATSNTARIQIRSSFQRGFVAKLRYMLPQNKTIFDTNIDDFQEKMWRNTGVDMSDFFNYGLNEKQWKDYCKLMQAQIRGRRFGQSKTTADEGRQSLKVGAIEVLDRKNNEYLPFIDSMGPSLCNSDVIIEIAMHDSSNESEIKRQHIKENGVSTDDGGANLHSNSRNTAYANCRMINGDKILPFPMDSYSAEDRECKEEQSQIHYDAHLTKLSREKKTELLITHSEVELTGSNEMGKQQSSRKQGEHSLSHVRERSPKRVRFYPGSQTSHHELDLNLAEYLCSPKVESVREKIEDYVSERVQKQFASRSFPY